MKDMLTCKTVILTNCNTLQHTLVCETLYPATHCTALHCHVDNTLQHTGMHRNMGDTLQQSALHCNIRWLVRHSTLQ